MRTDVHDDELDLVLDKKETVADGVVRLTLRSTDGAELPVWEAGAHLDLVLTDELTRQYSLCGDPAERSILQVAALREPDGRGGSAYVHDTLAEGDTVHVRGPRNHFPLTPAGRYVFVAGGIGITPLLPMIARAEAAGADWRLVYGGRTRTSMAFREHLEQSYPDRVEIRPADETGLLDLPTILAEPGATADDIAVYCCGPEPLLAAVEQECTRWPRGALHLERFAPKAGTDDGPRESFEVELSQSRATLTVPADRSILEVVENAGIPVLSSCQEGTCGTCETGVLDGVPDHRDSVLSDDEQADGDVMMICVSRSCSARLVLDL
ncbi:ferredoxin (plasmid) [Pseudonocardia sp. EC080610-09]|uniref:PDR/VanB family oxidoreductase n=1 Tax=unclassified Pseudonocardia TaxID=2619320 RepID=UPI000705AFD8|nr:MULTISPECIES: PDR/VanB family oxidoreductase [unclassified Pseudonocardia]ALL79573.1 ferredoxin [Pseudonocardia sp. EC080610-09]ALL85473.1 ferredoxin [Pseudonocardia sp. EC080619-01]